MANKRTTPADQGIAAAKADAQALKRGRKRVLITITRTDGIGTVLDSFIVVSDWRNCGVEEEAVGTHASNGLLIERITRALEDSNG
jgi:hypothetical protein